MGKIQDQDTCTLILEYGLLSSFHRDTIKVENSSFTIKGLINEPTLAVIKNNSDQIALYIEPGAMKIILSMKNLKDLSLTGSKTEQELNGLNKILDVSKNRDSVLINFVINSPKSYLVPQYLYDLGYRKKISCDSLKMIFNRLDESVQNSRYARITRGFIRGIENTTEGNFASDFKAIDLHNQPLTLSQFKNKNIVLLDFWASWCVPCRQSIPHLKTLYNKYHSKDLEIISIACMDQSRLTWESAIKEDSTFMWNHVATFFQDGETVSEDLSFDYPLGPIPRVILIDKDGKVSGNWVGYEQENEISIDNKLETLFSE
jgi:thiol-disulfide isomerase/thioredoxin